MKKLFAIAVVTLAAIVLWTTTISPRLDSPERQVARYLAATSSGNEKDALDAWPAFTGGFHPTAGLLARRADVTHELATARVGGSYRVMSTEWWRTCCEPGQIQDPGNAGLARVHVVATDSAGREHPLVFQVFVKEIVWHGDAAGESVKDWKLYEVYREAERCIFPSSAYGCVTVLGRT
jgi:hypothetical protein